MYKRDFKLMPDLQTNLARQSAELDEEEKKKAGPATAVQRSPLDRIMCQAADQSYATAHISALHRSMGFEPARVTDSLLHLQQNYGNRYVQRVVSLARQAAEPEAGPEIENAIQQKKGGGQPLGSGVRRQMESSFQADFSNVRVHHDSHADTLNRALNARAFTTGQDIFFRQGTYNPGTSGGKELLAHELTHVVQQNGDGIRTKLTVSEPGDALEREADQIAKSVIQTEQQPQDASLQRQPEALPEEEEEKKKRLYMKADRSVLAQQADEQPKHLFADEVAHTVQQRSSDAVQCKLIQADSEGDKAPPATASATAGAPATTVNTLWNINFIDQFAGTGTKIEGRKDTTSLYVRELKVAPDGEAGTPPPTPKVFAGVTLTATGKSEMGSYTHPKDKGGKVSSSVAYGTKPTFDFTIKTVDYDPKTADKAEKAEAARAKAMNSGAAHKAVVKELTDALDTFVDEKEAQAVLTKIVNAHFESVAVEATIKMTSPKTTTPINTTDLNYGALSADKTFNLVVKIPKVTKDKSSSYTTIKGGEVTKGVETSKEEGKEKGVATKSTVETEFIQSFESAFMNELKTAAEKVKTSANVDEKSTTHSGKMAVKNSTSAKLSGDINGSAELDLGKIPLAGKILGKLLNAKVNISLKPDLSDTFELEHSSTDEEAKKTIKSEESKVRNELSTAMQTSVKNLWSTKLKTSVETSTHETTTEKTGEKKNVDEKKTESSSATSTNGSVTIVANAVQPELVEE